MGGRWAMEVNFRPLYDEEEGDKFLLLFIYKSKFSLVFNVPSFYEKDNKMMGQY